MTLSQDSRSGARFLRLAIGLMVLASLAASQGRAQDAVPRAAPAPAISEAERARRLEERDRIVNEALRLVEAGDLNGVAAALGKKLELERAVLGEGHEDVVATLEMRSRFFEARAD